MRDCAAQSHILRNVSDGMSSVVLACDEASRRQIVGSTAYRRDASAYHFTNAWL